MSPKTMRNRLLGPGIILDFSVHKPEADWGDGVKLSKNGIEKGDLGVVGGQSRNFYVWERTETRDCVLRD